MSIKINNKIISIPPYISTSWSKVESIYIQGKDLAVLMTNGETLFIPYLEESVIQQIFEHHTSYLEARTKQIPIPVTGDKDLNQLMSMMEKMNNESTIRFSYGTSLDNLDSVMQHNPDQRDAPNIPDEVLKKIGMISKIIAPNNELMILKAEEGCNCFHCQMTRALNPEHSTQVLEIEEEIVTDEELQFRQWDIDQVDKQLFTVINRLDQAEKYTVFLGEPVGCTCGKTGCEHILSVLKS